VEQPDVAGAQQSAPEIGVLAVKLDRGVEAADAVEGRAADGEVAA